MALSVWHLANSALISFNTKSLVQDIVFSFLFPWVFYLLGAGWFQLTGGLTPLKLKVLLSATLGFTLYSLVLTGVSESETLKATWIASPFLWSCAYAICTGAILWGATMMLIRIWKPHPS